MIAIAFENGKFYVGDAIPAQMPEIHPAALMFPTKDEVGVQMLAEHIHQKGLRNPIVMTPTDELLEGRGRWKACQLLGLTPTTRIERGDPWLFILRRNARHLEAMTDAHRAMIAGHVPRWTSSRAASATRRYGDPPTLDDVAKAARVSRAAISRAQMIFWDGIAELQQIVIEGRVPIFTAARVSEQPSEVQKSFVTRVRNGENPKFIAPQDHFHPDGRRNRSRGVKTPAPARNKNRYVRPPTVRQLIDVLAGVQLVISAADGGLDPAITPKEAATLLRELTSNRVAYRHLSELLKGRILEES